MPYQDVGIVDAQKWIREHVSRAMERREATPSFTRHDLDRLLPPPPEPPRNRRSEQAWLALHLGIELPAAAVEGLEKDPWALKPTNLTVVAHDRKA